MIVITGDLGFFRYMIPDPQLPSNLFECTPLAMTYAIA